MGYGSGCYNEFKVIISVCNDKGKSNFYVKT